MSRVRVSSSAPTASRRARHSAHRRCREFESRHPLRLHRAERDTLPTVDVASSSLVIRSDCIAPSATLCPPSMSRVRVSSSAPTASRRARHSAHRRCREFESRHPLRLHRAERDTLPTVDVASSSLVIRSDCIAPSATLCPPSMSRVRVSSSAPTASRRARHPAHRRCTRARRSMSRVRVSSSAPSRSPERSSGERREETKSHPHDPGEGQASATTVPSDGLHTRSEPCDRVNSVFQWC